MKKIIVMKKQLLSIIALLALVTFLCTPDILAQDTVKKKRKSKKAKKTEQVEVKEEVEVKAVEVAPPPVPATPKSLTPVVQEEEPAIPTTKIEFDTYEHDFGTITQGDKVEHTFIFTNVGENPLVISRAKGSCGCTVPSYPKGEIAPGETGEIKVVFNSRGKANRQVKTVTLYANTDPDPTRLKIKAQVNVPPPAPEKPATPVAKPVEKTDN